MTEFPFQLSEERPCEDLNGDGQLSSFSEWTLLAKEFDCMWERFGSYVHLIVFKSRGSTRDGTGVHDSIVNQLLTKIDGVESLNNVLLIGMTNRKDLIDEALLRPGRLEVQVEISLPDENDCLQIL